MDELEAEQQQTAGHIADLLHQYAGFIVSEGHNPQEIKRLLNGLMEDAAGFVEDLDALNERYSELAARAPREVV